MIDFENKSYLKLKETDKNDFMDLIGGILVKGEEVVSCYRSVRDGVVFTNKRLIAINIQGITGKKKAITVLPFDRIQAFSVETASSTWTASSTSGSAGWDRSCSSSHPGRTCPRSAVTSASA